MSIQSLRNQIEETEDKIRECREAQQKVEHVRGITQPKKTNWWFSYRALKNNEELRNELEEKQRWIYGRFLRGRWRTP